MNRELAARALDEAFVAHTGVLFRDYLEDYKEGDDSRRDAFLEKFHNAKHAYDTAATHLEMTEDHPDGGPEDDNSYRTRLQAYRGARASKSAVEIAHMDTRELESYGVVVGIPRRQATWKPPAPVQGA